MYTGNLIDELLKTVERSEQRSIGVESQEAKRAHFYSQAQSELLQVESELVGAA